MSNWYFKLFIIKRIFKGPNLQLLSLKYPFNATIFYIKKCKGKEQILDKRYNIYRFYILIEIKITYGIAFKKVVS